MTDELVCCKLCARVGRKANIGNSAFRTGYQDGAWLCVHRKGCNKRIGVRRRRTGGKWNGLSVRQAQALALAVHGRQGHAVDSPASRLHRADHAVAGQLESREFHPDLRRSRFVHHLSTAGTAMTERILPTKAQYELLAWMVETVERRLAHPPAEPTTAWERRQYEFTGGDLINYYAEQNAKKGRSTSGSRGGGYAQHGWRRAGGTALANLAKRGFVDEAGWTQHSIPMFRLNVTGRAVLDGPKPKR